MVLGRLLTFADTPEQLVQLILEHKINKLRGRGLEYIAEPDVPSAAGLDLLERRLEAIAVSASTRSSTVWAELTHRDGAVGTTRYRQEPLCQTGG